MTIIGHSVRLLYVGGRDRRASRFPRRCGGGDARRFRSRPTARPSILLVTLDTTRADAIGPDAAGVETPAFNALAARGRRFRQAYATVPETLPSHTSMMTGLYPAGHGVHENARVPAGDGPCSPSGCTQAGYRTAAFVSAFVARAALRPRARIRRLRRRRRRAGEAERSSKTRPTRRSRSSRSRAAQPLFLWVHYYDPHYPVRAARAVPHALREQRRTSARSRRWTSSSAARPGVRAAASPDRTAIVVVADHGEGLGRSRRGAARQSALSVDDARAAGARRARASPPA